jgi:hypothetical protein
VSKRRYWIVFPFDFLFKANFTAINRNVYNILFRISLSLYYLFKSYYIIPSYPRSPKNSPSYDIVPKRDTLFSSQTLPLLPSMLWMYAYPQMVASWVRRLSLYPPTCPHKLVITITSREQLCVTWFCVKLLLRGFMPHLPSRHMCAKTAPQRINPSINKASCSSLSCRGILQYPVLLLGEGEYRSILTIDFRRVLQTFIIK